MCEKGKNDGRKLCLMETAELTVPRILDYALRTGLAGGKNGFQDWLSLPRFSRSLTACRPAAEKRERFLYERWKRRYA